MNLKKTMLTLAMPVSLAGCSSMPTNMPLIFGETVTVGISIGASTADQGADLTVGFKSKDIAIVPVTTKSDGSEALTATVTSTGPSEKAVIGPDGKMELTKPEKTSQSVDAFSVLGQFSSTTDAGARQVGLGKFFATGNAAVQLAGGFKECLKNGSCSGNSESNAKGSNPAAKTIPETTSSGQ